MNLGFQALNSSLPFPSLGVDYAVAYTNHVRLLNTQASDCYEQIPATNFITLVSSRGIANLEAAKWRLSYGAEYWRVYEMSTAKMLELGVKIVKGREESTVDDGERATAIKGEFFAWGNIPGEAIVASYGEGSGDTTDEEESIKPVVVKRKLGRPRKGSLRENVLAETGAKRKVEDKVVELPKKK
jgi:hypothetical protein